jgi:hypothetical protein
MNNPATQNITILHDAQEWSTDLDGEIGEIRVDGKRLSDIHDLTRKVEGVAQSIKTLVLCLGAIVLICLVCNIAMATWVAKYDSNIRGTINVQRSEIERLSHSKGIMGEKLKSLGWIWDARTRDWQQIANTTTSPSK